MKDFDAERKERFEAAGDRTFKIGDREFHFRPTIEAEILDSYFDAMREGSNAVALKASDAFVLAALDPQCHEDWQHVRHQHALPVATFEVQGVINFMLEVMLKRPTERRTDSTGTPEASGTSSTEKSHSAEEQG